MLYPLVYIFLFKFCPIIWVESQWAVEVESEKWKGRSGKGEVEREKWEVENGKSSLHPWLCIRLKKIINTTTTLHLHN